MEQRELEMSGVRFCGEVTAGVSHEIKNVLAIINETAGLFDDLARQAATLAAPLEPARASEAAAAIGRQVRRADRIVRDLNRFAHSFDRDREQVELVELSELFTALAGRMVAARGAALQVVKPEVPVWVQSSPFLLLQLLWRSLAYGLAVAGNGAELSLTVSVSAEGETGGQVALQWSRSSTEDDGSENEMAPEFPGPLEQQLLAALPGKAEGHRQPDGFLLVLP